MSAMLRNYFIITLRSLQKNGIYSFINISGLAIGLTCCILILLWIRHEISYDNFHQDRKRIYRVYLNTLNDNGIGTQMAVPLPLWEEFKNDRDIEYVAPTNWGGRHLLSYGDKKLYKNSYYAGDDFLKMFSFPILKGSKHQLKDPSTMVITESTALALFGADDPLGKIIRVDDKVDLTVTAIVKDVPSNSSFQFDCLMPFTTYTSREPWVKEALDNWTNNSFNMYVTFREGVNPEEVEQRVKDVIKRHEDNNDNEVTFLSMERWRLYSSFQNGKSVAGGIIYVRMLMILAVFILVIACINFTNLATARSARRAKEVGIRKTIGSRRNELIIQFLGETCLIALIAFIIAVGLVEVVLPFFNSLVNKDLSISYDNPIFWLMAAVFVAATGLIAGSYPAFYLSSFKPATVLKGKMQAGKNGALPRKVMVTMQFFFSILLIISTLVIHKQLSHLRERPTGYDRENLMIVGMDGDIQKNYRVIKQDLLSTGAVSSVCQSSSPVTAIYAFMDAGWQGKREDQRTSFALVATEYDYTKTMGIKILQGRDFSDAYHDSASMILNQAAIDYIGLKDPLGEKITWDNREFTVVGVIGNVVMDSPHQPVRPMMLIHEPYWASDLTLRLNAGTDLHAEIDRIQEIFRKHNPSYPFTYRFADEEFNRKFATIELISTLVNVFAILAIIISCLGLFGLAAFTAEQRTKEIGIRKVLGATMSNVVILLSKDFSVLVIVAFVLAAPLAWVAMSEWLNQFVYRISIEWWMLTGSGLLALLVALFTVSFQAIKAAIANPVKALRNE